MKLSLLLHETGIKCPQDIQDTADKIEITGITLDSRRVQTGNLFVCAAGEHTDGHIYAEEAVWNGAAAVLAERDIGKKEFPVLQTEHTRAALAKIARAFYGDPAADMKLLGVTGTNGKTTITRMVHGMFLASGQECGVIGTIGYHTGSKSREREAARTTPEAFEIWELLSEMRNNDVKNCAMEVSSHGLALGRVDELKFNAAIFSNLTGDHMDFHKTMEEYYQAKKKLFYMTEGLCIINQDDAYGARLRRELTEEGKSVCSCSLQDPSADIFAEVISSGARGSRVILHRKEGRDLKLELRVPGRFNICNAVQAAACGPLLGIGDDEAAAALSQFSGAPGRFELVENNRDMTVIVDYAHTPDALENVLKTARSFTAGRLITVFGCGGDRDRGKRPVMGGIAGSLSDFCIITSDNPRTEPQEQIAAEIEAGIRETGCAYEVIGSRKDAINRAVSMYQQGDVAVVAGKGHETYQIIGGSKNYFSDKETIQRALR